MPSNDQITFAHSSAPSIIHLSILSYFHQVPHNPYLRQSVSPFTYPPSTPHPISPWIQPPLHLHFYLPYSFSVHFFSLLYRLNYYVYLLLFPSFPIHQTSVLSPTFHRLTPASISVLSSCIYPH